MEQYQHEIIGPAQATPTGRLQARFTRSSWPWIAAGVAILLTLPSLRAGWFVDDHFIRLKMLRPARFADILGPPLDLFRFLDGDSERTRRLMDEGLTPWWTVPELRAAFWRPIAALTHWLDFQLWPASPAMMHLHSVLWLGALVVIIGFFYRRIMPGAQAGLATLLYAIDDAHGFPVGFIANRNAIIATFLGVLAIMWHDRWRRGGPRRAGAVAPILFGLSLLSSEAGLATTAYLFAYAVCLDGGTWRRRLATLLPYAVIVVLWRAIWSYQGYGVSAGMEAYIDPLREPAAYAATLPERVPPLLLGQWLLPPADLCFVLSPNWSKVYALGALVLILPIGVVLWWALRRTKNMRFWATGMLLSLLPIAATIPADRLLFFVGLGGMPLAAEFLVQWRQGGKVSLRRPWTRLAYVSAGVALFAVHVLFAPINLMFRAAYLVGSPTLRRELELAGPFDPSVEKQDLVIVNAPVPFLLGHFPMIQALNGNPMPRHFRVLSASLPSIQVKRPDAFSLVIRPELGFLEWSWDRVLRTDRYPLRAGERIELSAMIVEITSLNSVGRPAEALFRFPVPLEDASLRWLHWTDGRFEPWTPPAVGEIQELRPRSPRLWSGAG